MIALFLDTNIIVDFMADRKPFSEAAARLFDYAERGKIKIYLSSLSYSNIYYVIRKVAGHKKTMALLKELELITEVVDVTKGVIKLSVSSGFKDFEDAIQYFSALSDKKISAIVTRDPKDYKRSDIAILTPDEALSFVEKHS